MMLLSLLTAWVICTALLGLLIYYRFPDNHGWGRDFFQWIYALFLLLSVACMKLSLRAGAGLLILSIIGLGLIYCINEWNILVGYDEWIERGMPDWGAKRIRELERPEGSYWTGEAG